MRLLALFLTIVAPVIAQTYSDVTAKPSHSAATIKWTTSAPAGTYIKYGPGASYGRFSHEPDTSRTAHEWFVSGLNPATEYHYRVCSNEGSCDPAGDRTFTTLPKPADSQTMPELPKTPAFPAMPSSWATKTTITDCAKLQPAIDKAASADGNANHLIEITASLDCSFEEGSGEGFGGGPMLNFPAKKGPNSSGAGWIIIRSAGVLPPEGSRVTSDYFSGMPIFRVPPSLPERSGPPPGSSCIPGQIYWNFVTPGWGLHTCTDGPANGYSLIPKTDFSGPIPGSCAKNNSWYFKSDEADPSSIFWCGGGKLYRINIGATNAGANIGFAAGAHHYRISGIRFLPIPIASGGMPAYWKTLYTADLAASVGLFDLYSAAGVHDIIIERNQVDISYPYRLRFVALVRANDVVIAHNHVHANFHLPTLGDSIGCNPCTAGFVQLAGSKRTLIDNNYVDLPGIQVFGMDDNPDGTFDVRVTRNYLTNPAKYIQGRDENTAYCGGCFFSSRHIVELKMGSRWLIEGNTIAGHFSSTNNQGDVFSISTRPGPRRVPISDVWIRNNVVSSVPNLAYFIGHNSFNEQAAATARVAFTGNLVHDIDGRRVPAGQPAREGRAFRLFYGLEDTLISNNTILNACTGYAPYLAMNDLGPSAGLQLTNNVVSGCAVDPPYHFLGAVGFGGGTTGLSAGWPAVNSYKFTGNVVYNAGGKLSGRGYPSGNQWPSSLAAVGFRAANDYSLAPGSKFASAGADMEAIRAAQGEISSHRANPTSATTATLQWTAPDASAICTVEYGTSPKPGTGTRVVDATANRTRSKELTGLTAGIKYHYRIYCGQMVAGAFTTQ